MRSRSLLCLLLLGCGSDADPGGLEVSWRTGRLTCEQAGVDQVAVELYDFTGEAAAATRARCDATSAALESVATGDYALLLRGFDPDGCWTHTARRDDVTIESGEVLAVGSLPLLRRARPLQVRWPFANELDCTGNEVQQVEITIEVDDTFARTEKTLCPGLARDFDDIPRGNLRVWIYALDEAGHRVASGIVEYPADHFEAEPCADVVDARVPLEMCPTDNCA